MNLISDLRIYIQQHEPLEIKDFDISELGAGEYNQNFTVTTGDVKYVLRVSISQLSGSAKQLKHEYDTLNYLSNYGIAPKPLYLDMNGFEYPVLLEEFVEGSLLNTLDEDVLKAVGASMAQISNIPVKEGHPFEVREINYQFDLRTHSSTLEKVKRRDEYEELFQDASQQLKKLQSELVRLPKTSSLLIRRDANPTNILVTNNGIKWIDWEIARIDDPTITLASFVNEMLLYDVQKLGVEQKHMDIVINEFRKCCPMDDFESMLENRLKIERIGGLVWGIERMDNYYKTNQSNSSKIEWYKEICRASLDALNS